MNGDLSRSPLAHEIEFLAIKLFSMGTRRANDALLSVSLRVRLYSVLALANSDAHPTQRDLAEFLELDPSQIVALVTELENRGLVIREIDPSDRRSKVVTATPRGAKLFEEARAVTGNAESETLSALTSDEQAALLRLLRKAVFGP